MRNGHKSYGDQLVVGQELVDTMPLEAKIILERNKMEVRERIKKELYDQKEILQNVT